MRDGGGRRDGEGRREGEGKREGANEKVGHPLQSLGSRFSIVLVHFIKSNIIAHTLYSAQLLHFQWRGS